MDQRQGVQPPETPETADKASSSEGTGFAAHNDAMRENRQIAEPAHRNTGDDRQLRQQQVESHDQPVRRPVLDERGIANVERLLRKHASLVHEIE